LRYQWRFNGVNIPDATNAMFTIADVQVANDGDYSVMVSDNIGPTTSQNARLSVLVVPVIVVPPMSQSVVQGGDVTFSAQVTGHPMPFTFEWRKGSLPLVTNVLNQTVGFFTLTNVQAAAAGNYRLVVKNQALPAPGVASGFATLAVLSDTDGDGIPDEWESSHGLDPGSNSDRNADSDGDGMANWQEYIAGTNPTNAASYLKVAYIWSGITSNQQVRLEFNAVSNKTYSIFASESDLQASQIAPEQHLARLPDVVGARQHGQHEAEPERGPHDPAPDLAAGDLAEQGRDEDALALIPSNLLMTTEQPHGHRSKEDIFNTDA
jgi:hypothetical protein